MYNLQFIQCNNVLDVLVLFLMADRCAHDSHSSYIPMQLDIFDICTYVHLCHLCTLTICTEPSKPSQLMIFVSGKWLWTFCQFMILGFMGRAQCTNLPIWFQLVRGWSLWTINWAQCFSCVWEHMHACHACCQNFRLHCTISASVLLEQFEK